MNNLSKTDIAEKLQNLVTDAHQFACSLDIGDERIEAFELYEALRRLQRRGTAGKVLAATNPLHCAWGDDDSDEDVDYE